MWIKGLILALALYIPMVAHAEDIVSAKVICPKAVITKVFEAFKLVIIEGTPTGCRSFTLVTGIVKIIAGPEVDADGDEMFIVQLDEAGTMFTIAWPGINTSLKKTKAL